MPSPSPQYTLQLSTNRADTDFKVKMSANLCMLFRTTKQTQHQISHIFQKIENKKRPASLQVFAKFGSPTWTRTRDLRINSPSLYQLSYQGIDKAAILLAVSFSVNRQMFLCG
jgi:hypothetical protein